VSEGEIVVTSNEELHAARLSGKRLLALWNALPDVDTQPTKGRFGSNAASCLALGERPLWGASRPIRELD
jgi:hypothetical protein